MGNIILRTPDNRLQPAPSTFVHENRTANKIPHLTEIKDITAFRVVNLFHRNIVIFQIKRRLIQLISPILAQVQPRNHLRTADSISVLLLNGRPL